MKRKIVKIIEEKCNGCGICINACHEGALQLINGKAKLISDIYCDGLGDCLPACPTNAIEIIEREAEEYDEAAVMEKINKQKGKVFNGCPSMQFKKNENKEHNLTNLNQWPCQIRLVPYNAKFLNNCDLLIAADCTAFAYPKIQEIMKDKVTIIGCPKLDDEDYSNKFIEIFKYNNINSITILRMEVPCCGGIVSALNRALEQTNTGNSVNIITVSVNGEVV